MTIDQIQALREAGSRHGLRDVIDYGEGAVMTNYAGLPEAKALAGALDQGGLERAIGEIVSGAVPTPVQLNSGSVRLQNAWGEPPGSGAVTRELQKYLQDPAVIAKFEAPPAFRQTVLDRFERDAAFAKATGQPVRQDLQRARGIIVDDDFNRLFRALQRGAAVPAAALLSPLMSGLPEEDRRE
jgi:hypothetical protein